ncbi:MULTISPECIES: twin-arginine translocation signal domain-containing protein [Halorussus]|uniref:twin-arginine translocation signal domain-containing protein n=1 Tax=Halorussus TaxID=1070314 RepID=UPI00209F97B2|nr:twin-arginine translocation signal domain-containing protein [Halorussus vallis]USZ77351.1 twin-arginine translocation signal domain-containing protein [Halorussus vallis]
MRNDINRRNVLKGLGAGAATLGGVGVNAAAKGQPEVTELEGAHADRVIADYDNPDAVRRVLAEHDDMLQELQQRGLLESADVDNLGVDTLSPLDPEGKTESEQVVAKKIDDTVTPEIVIGRKTPEGMLTIGIRPETGERYALVNSPEETKAEVLDDVTTMWSCSDPCCDASCCPVDSCEPNTICACNDCCVNCSCGVDPACWGYCA